MDIFTCSLSESEVFLYSLNFKCAVCTIFNEFNFTKETLYEVVIRTE